jgi:hypothetical protein
VDDRAAKQTYTEIQPIIRDTTHDNGVKRDVRSLERHTGFGDRLSIRVARAWFNVGVAVFAAGQVSHVNQLQAESPPRQGSMLIDVALLLGSFPDTQVL